MRLVGITIDFVHDEEESHNILRTFVCILLINSF